MKRLTAEDTAIIDEHRDDDGRDHDLDALREPDGGEHRIERRRRCRSSRSCTMISQKPLASGLAPGSAPPCSMARISSALCTTSKAPAAEQHESRTETSAPLSVNSGRAHTGDPQDREEQRDAREHREARPQEARAARAAAAAAGRPGATEEDDVVDAEDDLEHRERQEGKPRLRVEQQLHPRSLRQPVDLFRLGELALQQIVRPQPEIERRAPRRCRSRNKCPR